jgi:hypothetical protein
MSLQHPAPGGTRNTPDPEELLGAAILHLCADAAAQWADADESGALLLVAGAWRLAGDFQFIDYQAPLDPARHSLNDTRGTRTKTCGTTRDQARGTSRGTCLRRLTND